MSTAPVRQPKTKPRRPPSGCFVTYENLTTGDPGQIPHLHIAESATTASLALDAFFIAMKDEGHFREDFTLTGPSAGREPVHPDTVCADTLRLSQHPREIGTAYAAEGPRQEKDGTP